MHWLLEALMYAVLVGLWLLLMGLLYFSIKVWRAERRRLFAGPPTPSFLFGNMFELLASVNTGALVELIDGYSSMAVASGNKEGVFQYRILTKIVTVVYVAEVQKFLLEKHSRDMILDRVHGHGISSFAPKGLLGLPSGRIAQMHRRAMLPMFSQRQIDRNYGPLIFNKTLFCCRRLKENLAMHGRQSGKVSLSIGSISARFAFDVVGMLMFNIELKTMNGASFGQERQDSIYSKAILHLCEEALKTFIGFPIFKYWPHRYRKTQQSIGLFADIARRIFRERAEDKTGELSDKVDMVTQLLNADEKSPQLSEDEIVDEMLVLLVAGHETTANTISFMSYYLAKHQDVQDKVLQELHELPENTWTAENVHTVTKQAPYLRAVTDEVLRLKPTVANLASRNTTKPITLPSGTVLPAGSTLKFHLYRSHRDPAFWGDDAEDFRPERMLEEKKKKGQIGLEVAPFGAGMRNCVGERLAKAEILIFFALLLQRFQLTIPKNQQLTHSFKITLTPFAEEGKDLKIIFSERN